MPQIALILVMLSDLESHFGCVKSNYHFTDLK